jgi:uncharacterized protein (DUF488 family)
MNSVPADVIQETMPPSPDHTTIHTIGHSTRSLDELVELLSRNRVAIVADVRRFPGSRRHPHFAAAALAEALPAASIRYLHIEDLGGRRRGLPGSVNDYWRNASFRAYADYMGTAGYAAAVDRLLSLGEGTAIMCSEAVPWRCHRNMIADDLTRRAVEVLHIVSSAQPEPHVLNPVARVEGGHLVYRASPDQLSL